MADITSNLAQYSAAACPTDIIQLHAVASNHLQRSLRALNSDEPNYELVAQHLGEALDAVRLLWPFNINAH